MDIREFAERQRLSTQRDDCGDVVIHGKAGSISEAAGGRLSLMLLFDSPRKWSTTRRKLQAAGFVIRQDGETEGVLTFDPKDRKQSGLALKIGGIRKPRVLSAAQMEVLRDHMAEVRARKAA
jgi:hypothetical protein